MSYMSLPPELVGEILGALPCDEVERQCSVSTQHNAICQDPEFWDKQIRIRNIEDPAVWPMPGGGRPSFTNACAFRNGEAPRLIQAPGGFEFVFTADGRALVTVAYDFTHCVINRLDVNSGDVAATFNIRIGSRPIHGVSYWHNERIQPVLSRDGRTVAIAVLRRDRAEVHHIGLWDAATGRARVRLDARGDWQPRGTDLAPSAACMLFSPDGATIATCHGYTIKLWDVATGVAKHTLIEAHRDITNVDFSSDGRVLCVHNPHYDQGHTGQYTNWSTETGRAICKFFFGPTTEMPKMSPDGRVLLCPDLHGGLALDVSTLPTALAPIRASVVAHRIPTAETMSWHQLAWSSDGHTLAIVNAHGTVDLWDMAHGPTAMHIKHTLATVPPPSAVIFSPDGSMLAMVSEQAVSLWDANDYSFLRTLAPCFRSGVQFSPDGRMLLTGGIDVATFHIWMVRH